MSNTIELGIPDLAPLTCVARRPERWAELQGRLQRRLFFRSEGFRAPVGAPQQISGELLEQCRVMTHAFDRFYRHAIDQYGSNPTLRPEFLVQPGFAPAIEAEPANHPPLAVARLDLVRTADGSLKVIELNPTALCLLHLRASLYLTRELRRIDEAADAERLDSLASAMVRAFGATSSGGPPVLGVIWLPSIALPMTQHFFREAFERRGWKYILGTPAELDLEGDVPRLRGVPIERLWADNVIYFGYQFARYRDTKFPTKFGDYGSAPAEAEKILGNPRFLAHLRSGRLSMFNPLRALLTLSKGLLSWAHRDDRGIPPDLAKYLREHTARTYGVDERARGDLTKSQALRNKDELLLKPCQYGGAHGVVAGIDTSGEQWAHSVEERWEDPEWVLQEYYEPCATPGGDTVSIGIHSYAGTFGGMSIRLGKGRVVSARDSWFIPVVGL